MKPTVLVPISKEMKIQLTNERVELSQGKQYEIEDFWNDINKKGTFHRGEVFHVSSVEENPHSMVLQLQHSDYAHYLYSVRHPMDEESCNIIYSAGLVETTDGTLVFGEMARNTAYPGRLQCVGGGLSKEELVDSYFDMKKSVLRELSEELGLNADGDVVACTPTNIKTGGTYNFTVVLYHIEINLTEDELKERYQLFVEELASKGEVPEFEEVHYIKRDQVEEFILKNERDSVDYLMPYLELMTKKI